MFIDEVRARRGGEVVGINQFPAEASGPASVMNSDYQPSRHLHPSHTEWFNHNEDTYFRAQSARGRAKKIRDETTDLVNNRRILSAGTQRQATEKLGERIIDTSDLYTRGELELINLREEDQLLRESKITLEYSLAQVVRPLKVNNECLRLREKREGIEEVNDVVQRNLKREKESIEKYLEKFETMQIKVENQLVENSKSERILEQDLFNKKAALDIDTLCVQLDKCSANIESYEGIERTNPEGSIPETWQQKAENNINFAAEKRSLSAALRQEVDSLINVAAAELLQLWTNTNRSFHTTITEHKEVKSKLIENLNQTSMDIRSKDCLIQRLNLNLSESEVNMMMAQTRMERRNHRPGLEACDDPAHEMLLKEVDELTQTQLMLKNKMEEVEEAKSELTRSKTNLEEVTRLNIGATKVDEKECMVLRENFPFKLRCDTTTGGTVNHVNNFNPSLGVHQVCFNHL